ncbi:hypothetical protein PV05_07953 [Exophiala xenobiotica]|uniref:Uncharacterized protein n=1 Tax=Exophiala xenobiotica TaxID=348802 RepID=A0A0D2BIU3_9EURO|nr:uncharacterized protein PV05_07953 [Exophiala xenobiotica]KIW52306.1 hypothetical protein PV05_07953 [Exophiala xenobiotica]
MDIANLLSVEGLHANHAIDGESMLPRQMLFDVRDLGEPVSVTGSISMRIFLAKRTRQPETTILFELGRTLFLLNTLTSLVPQSLLFRASSSFLALLSIDSIDSSISIRAVSGTVMVRGESNCGSAGFLASCLVSSLKQISDSLESSPVKTGSSREAYGSCQAFMNRPPA